MFSRILLLTLAFIGGAVAINQVISACQAREITSRTVEAFTMQTGLQCPNASTSDYVRRYPGFSLELSCDVGDVWQRFAVSYDGSTATITADGTEAK